jgi:hypothetical protein
MRIRSPPTGASESPMPPPERIVPDKRRELEDEEARREIEEER